MGGALPTGTIWLDQASSGWTEISLIKTGTQLCKASLTDRAVISASGLPFNNYQLLRQKLLTEEAIRTNWSRKNSKQLQGVVTRKSTTHRRASPSEIMQRRHQQPISSHGDSQPGKGTKPEINLNSNASKASNISTYILLAKRDEWTTQTRRLKRWTNQISFWRDDQTTQKTWRLKTGDLIHWRTYGMLRMRDWTNLSTRRLVLPKLN